MNNKEQLYKQMLIMDIDNNSLQGLDFESLKKLNVQEYIEYQNNRQIELLNKYTSIKIQDILNQKEILTKEMIEKYKQQDQQLKEQQDDEVEQEQQDDEEEEEEEYEEELEEEEYDEEEEDD